MTDRPTAEQRREPRTAAGRALLASERWAGMGLRGITSRNTLRHRWLLDAILAIEAEASREAEGVTERLLRVRTSLLDDIGTSLSSEFAQGSPFEPFDRIYVLKCITRVLDDARSRALVAAREKEERS